MFKYLPWQRQTQRLKPGLNKYLHCSVDLEMVLRAQELAPSGNHARNFEPKIQYLQNKAKQKFINLAPKWVWPRP